MAAIEALHILDEHNNAIFGHVYQGRPPPVSTLLPLYLQQSQPRPSLIYLHSTNPPTILYSIIQDNILFLSPSSSDNEPLLILEFLHRVADSLSEFLGSPLLTSKITTNYDIVAQIVVEIADGGIVCQGEPNALRDVVETGPGVLSNLLGGLGLPGSGPALGAQGSSGGLATLQRPPVQAQSAQGSAIPWRRGNVRHTSNEMYVDIVESLQVTIAPSGRPLSAFANGSIAFTSKVSGVPDLLLTLSTGGKGAGMGSRGDQLRNVMERSVFHPCVRLNRWKSDGVLSFVPPDGRFALAGYEVDLLGPEFPLNASDASNNTRLNLPASISITTNLGTAGNEFEVRLAISSPGTAANSNKSAATVSLQSNLGGGRPGSFRAASGGDSKSPTFDNLSVRIPLPQSARNVSDLRPSRGEAHWNPVEGMVEWKLSPKDVGVGAVLRCAVVGPLADEDQVANGGGIMNGMTATTYDYDEDTAYQAPSATVKNSGTSSPVNGDGSGRGGKHKALLMPTSAMLSFSVKGWLPSGLKVDSLLLDTKKSKGLGNEVRPYKGVKYLTVSRDGVETRC